MRARPLRFARLLAALALGCASRPETLPAERAREADCTASERESAIRRGLAFLLDRQNADGSWGRFESARPDEVYLDVQSSHRAYREATTALCCMALMQAGPGAPGDADARRAALARGLRHLVRAEADVRVSGSTFYNTWAHAYVLQALARALRATDPAAVPKEALRAAAQRWLQALLRIQNANGGWGYYDFGYSLQTPTGRMATSFTTATALLALGEARQIGLAAPETSIRAAVNCLRGMRTADKTYLYGWYAWARPAAGYNRPKGSLGRAQACNLALRRFTKDVSDEDLSLGLDRMLEHHHFLEIGRGRPIPHEAWYHTAGYYFYYGHWHAAEVVAELPRETQARYWQELADVMVYTQNKNGSWMDFPFYGYHELYGTAMAILTLVPAQAALTPAARP